MKKPRSKNKPRADSADYSKVVKRIKPVEELPFRLTAVFYGRSGTGKTTLSATFPKPLLLLDIKEDGTDSISDVKGIDVLRVKEWDEIEQVYWYLKSGKHKYRTVVLDAVTEMQGLAMAKARADWKLSDSDVISRRAWGQISSLMQTWVVNYRDLMGVENVVFLAHDRTHDADDEDAAEQLIPEVGPRLMPSVASHLAGAVKVIGNTFIREVREKGPDGKKKRTVEYRLRIGPHAYYLTKIRQPKSNYVPDSIANPTYDKVVSIIQGTYQQPKPKKRRK